jgi:hypothetical protein
MIQDQTRQLILSAADDYEVELPDSVTDAQKLHAAALSYVSKIEATTQPTIASITAPKDVAPIVDALLAWPQRDERLLIARRVEVEMRVRLNAAVEGFGTVLHSALGPVFTAAAADFTARYEAGDQQDPATVATLSDLVRVADALAGPVDQGFSMTGSDRPTRVLVWRTRNDMIRLRHRASDTQRGSQPWLEAALSLGATLTWQTRAEQIAHVAALPTGERPLATASTAGDAA